MFDANASSQVKSTGHCSIDKLPYLKFGIGTYVPAPPLPPQKRASMQIQGCALALPSDQWQFLHKNHVLGTLDRTTFLSIFLMKYSVTPCKGFWNLANFLVWNPESWGLESGIQLKEFRMPLTTGIQNPSSTDKKSRTQYLECRIHGVESRIQDYLGFPYVVRTEPLKSYLHDCPLQCL